MSISELMIAELKTEAAMTRSLLAKVPDDKLTWQPGEDLHTIGWNVAHIVEIIGWVPGIVTQSEWDIAPVGGEPYVAPAATNMELMLKTFDENLSQAISSLQGVPDSVMDESWSLKMGGQTFFTMKKGDCIRKWVFTHTAHHRGILSAYMRLAGLKFPSIYEE